MSIDIKLLDELTKQLLAGTANITQKGEKSSKEVQFVVEYFRWRIEARFFRLGHMGPETKCTLYFDRKHVNVSQIGTQRERQLKDALHTQLLRRVSVPSGAR